MKKIIGLAVVLSLFCCVGVFADDKEDVLNKKEMEQAEKYIEEMTSFVETFMNSFKNFVYQDEKQETINTDDKKLSGLTLFSKKKDGEIITKEQIRVFQILKPNTVLAKSEHGDKLTLIILDDTIPAGSRLG